MKKPVWVLRETVLTLHEQSLAEFGGAASISDEGMLDSALGKPENLFAYGKPMIFALPAGELSEPKYAAWLKANSRRTSRA